MTVLRAGVIGFGFMGQTHVRAYQAAADAGLPVRLAAIADLRADSLSASPSTRGNIATGADEPLFDPALVRPYPSAQALLDAGDLDIVSVCTPTHTHVATAALALRAGLHVLLEKPVATSPADAGLLIVAERAAGRRVMPAMCIRFWPGWSWLHDRIHDRRFGPLSSLHLTRLGSRPDWSPFYRDNALCGDAITDLHVHDADFLSHTLGFPSAVFSVGSTSHLTTAYLYHEGPFRGVQVFAEGGWLPSPGRGFRMRFAAEFENATAEFDLARSPALHLTTDGRTDTVPLPDGTGYDGQVRAFIHWAAQGGNDDPPSTLSQAARVLELIDAEKRSLISGTPVHTSLVH
jgi:predicted dehydrogenase